MYRSNHLSCSIIKTVLRNFAKFTGKHLCQSLFSPVPEVFSCKFCKICKNTFFTEHLRSTAPAFKKAILLRSRISVYRFQKDKTEKIWIKAIPNAHLRVSKDTSACTLRWSSRFEEIKVNRKSQQKDSPKIWEGEPTGASSQVPTLSPPLPPTTKACSSIFRI